MGLLLSILVGCVGVLELLSSLKQVSNEVSNSAAGTTSPCLSYHEPSTEIPSFHDSLCSITHSGDIPVSGSVKRKLENLHEYSLRVRSELKSAGGSDWGTLSDCSTRDLLSPSRTDSRHSLANLDPSNPNNDEDDAWRTLLSVLPTHQTAAIFIEDETTQETNERVTIKDISDLEVEEFITKGLVPAKTVDQYVRVPTPIPLGLSQEISRSNSSLSSSPDADSGNQAPTRTSFDQASGISTAYDKSSSSAESSIIKDDDLSSRVKKRGFITISRSRSPDFKNSLSQEQIFIKSGAKLLINQVQMVQDSLQAASGIDSGSVTSETQVDGTQTRASESSQRRSRSDKTRGTSTVLRKATRLKSKNAEISKSAENLTTAKGKRTKRQREPERRKSDISVQTIKQVDSFRDEWTNTSPTNSEASIGASRTSVSVQVQTSFDDKSPGDSPSFEIPVIGLSESQRDIGMKDRDHFGRRAFRNRRFPTSIVPKSRSLDDYTNNSHWVVGDVRRFGVSNDTTRDSHERFEEKIETIRANEFRDRKFTANEQRYELREPTRLCEDESSMDEEFVDAEEASTSLSGGGPIEYCIPYNEESDKPFWVNSTPWMTRKSVLCVNPSKNLLFLSLRNANALRFKTKLTMT